MPATRSANNRLWHRLTATTTVAIDLPLNHQGMGMSRLTAAILSVVLFFIALTANADPMTQIRSGMLVTGSIVVAADGSVQSYALDQQEKLPGVVVGLIGRQIPKWRFEPTMLDGHAVAAKSTMNLRIVAQKRNDGGYAFTIAGATFPPDTDAQTAAFAMRKQPTYPSSAVHENVSGTVYLTLRVNQQGAVIGGYAERVDLDTSPTAAPAEYQLKKWRSILAKSALDAALTWKFADIKHAGPTSGDWIATTPVNYHIEPSDTGPVDTYGRWETYLPGPVQQSPWPDAQNVGPANLDAIPAGSLALAATGLHLTTPLGGS